MTRQAEDINYPETAEEFWVLVEANKEDLQNLIAIYHPSYRRVHYKDKITAPKAEIVCEAIRKQVQQEERETDPQQEFRSMLNRKDPAITGIFSEVWRCMYLRLLSAASAAPMACRPSTRRSRHGKLGGLRLRSTPTSAWRSVLPMDRSVPLVQPSSYAPVAL